MPLGDEEVQVLESLSRNPKTYAANRDLIREGRKPEHVFLVMSGWAYRYKLLPNGNRQILAYLIPGDLCDVHIFLFDEMDHSIGLLSEAQVAAIPSDEMLEVMERFPKIERALWWSTLVDEATLREWLLNVGQRDAYERLAHLFCEMEVRMEAVGLIKPDGSFDFPLTQIELADTTGLTSVHVNRTLQRMRRDKLIEFGQQRMRILDFPGLRGVGQFNPNYLHVEEKRARSRSSGVELRV